MKVLGAVGGGQFLYICLLETVYRSMMRTSLARSLRSNLKIYFYLGIDPCASQPCMNGGTCLPTAGNSFSCMCPSSYQGVDCSIGKLLLLLDNSRSNAIGRIQRLRLLYGPYYCAQDYEKIRIAVSIDLRR
jgi:hypothetical protein